MKSKFKEFSCFAFFVKASAFGFLAKKKVQQMIETADLVAFRASQIGEKLRRWEIVEMNNHEGTDESDDVQKGANQRLNSTLSLEAE